MPERVRARPVRSDSGLGVLVTASIVFIVLDVLTSTGENPVYLCDIPGFPENSLRANWAAGSVDLAGIQDPARVEHPLDLALQLK